VIYTTNALESVHAHHLFVRRKEKAETVNHAPHTTFLTLL
jgi:hypothetical protein